MKLFVLAMAAALASVQLPPRDAPRAADKGTAVVRGTVIDAVTGDPLPRATVQLSRVLSDPAPPPAPAQTDAEGRFEFRDLPGGRYVVRADRTPYLFTAYGQRGPNGSGTPIDVADGQLVEKITIAMQPGGVVAGHVFDEFGLPAVNVRVQALQYRYSAGRRQLMMAMGNRSAASTDDRGAFRLFGLPPGQYYVSAVPQSVQMLPRVAASHEGPVATYFPNTPDATSAQRISVDPGKETTGLTITLVSGRLATVRGRAVMASGEPFVGGVNVTRLDEAGTSGFGGGLVKPDGAFEVGGLAPGQYILSIRPNNARFEAPVEMARTRLTIAGDDIDNLFLVGRPGATLRGVVVSDEGAPLPLTPAQVMIRIQPAPEDRGAYVQPPEVQEDFSFELKGLHGRARIQTVVVFGVSSGEQPPGRDLWAVRAVSWRGDDITDKYIDFDESPALDGVEIVLSRRWAELSVTVTDQRGLPASDAALVVFPADDGLWTPDSRAIRPMRTNAEGTFRLRGLPGGDYLIAVTGPIESGRWYDPEYLRALSERATRVSLTEGQVTATVLRLTTAQ